MRLLRVSSGWVSEHRLALAGQQRRRHHAVAHQPAAGAGQAEVGLPGTVAERQLAEQLLHVRRRVVAPAVLAEPVTGDVGAQGAVVAAVFDFRVAAPEAAPRHLQLAARVREAALGAQGQRAAQGVEAEGRVGAGDQVDAGDRRVGDQVPVHRVAEGLVDAHPVHVDRQPLGGAEQRRGGEAAVVEVHLEGVALGLVHRHRGHLAQQLLAHVQALGFLHALGAQRLHVGGQMLARHADASQRRGADHLDALGGHDGLGLGRQTCGSEGGQGGGDGSGQGAAGRGRRVVSGFHVALRRR